MHLVLLLASHRTRRRVDKTRLTCTRSTPCRPLPTSNPHYGLGLLALRLCQLHLKDSCAYKVQRGYAQHHVDLSIGLAHMSWVDRYVLCQAPSPITSTQDSTYRKHPYQHPVVPSSIANLFDTPSRNKGRIRRLAAGADCSASGRLRSPDRDWSSTSPSLACFHMTCQHHRGSN